MNYIILAKDNDSILKIFEPLFGPFISIAIVIFGIWAIIAHYFAIFRIRKETIKIRELLEDSLLITNDNEKED